MERVDCPPRLTWRESAEELGFHWHTGDTGAYWDESAYWFFTSDEIDEIESATETIWDLLKVAVSHVIDTKLLPLFGYDEATIKLIEHSWYNRGVQPTLYCRLDLAYDGSGAPKLLEVNGDTPTSLFEASVFQWGWLEELFPDGDQFNSIHDKLVEGFQKLKFFQDANPAEFGSERLLHLCSVAPHPEDEGTVNYIGEVARSVGFKTQFVGLTNVGWREGSYTAPDGFVDTNDHAIRTMFKLVPWEWLLSDAFGEKLSGEIINDRLTLIEPAWKMVLSNKRLLVTLWELFPHHPNLLNTSVSRANVPGPVAKKPVLGREGANVTLLSATDQVEQEQDGAYDDNLFVYQEQTKLAFADGNYALLGSWIVDGRAAGMGVRESQSRITNNAGRFVPHRFE